MKLLAHTTDIHVLNLFKVIQMCILWMRWNLKIPDISDKWSRELLVALSGNGKGSVQTTWKYFFLRIQVGITLIVAQVLWPCCETDLNQLIRDDDHGGILMMYWFGK